MAAAKKIKCIFRMWTGAEWEKVQARAAVFGYEDRGVPFIAQLLTGHIFANGEGSEQLPTTEAIKEAKCLHDLEERFAIVPYVDANVRARLIQNAKRTGASLGAYCRAVVLNDALDGARIAAARGIGVSHKLVPVDDETLFVFESAAEALGMSLDGVLALAIKHGRGAIEGLLAA